MKTLNEIYLKSKAYMFEKKSSTIYNEQIVEIANKVLVELYEDNNMCRMFNGKAPFTDGPMAHQVSSQNDYIDYEDEYVLEVIPKGITANLLLDDDLTKMAKYDDEYYNSKITHKKIVSQSVLERFSQWL